MFEHYVHYQAGDPRRRRRLQIAALASGATTFSLIAFMWVANKLNVVRVDPPTITYIMVQMSMDEPPPPPPPPPPPAGEESEPEEDIPEEEVELEEDIVQPKDTPENIPEVKSTGSKGPKAPGVPGGMPGGVPGGVPGGIPGGVVGGGAIATKRDTSKDQISKQPIKVVKGNGIYTPDCDASKLQQTQTARMGNRKGSTKISFCVSESGKVEDVRTIKKFPGDAKVDQICSAEVKKWRFKPFLVGGKPRKTCSVVEFKLIFN